MAGPELRSSWLSSLQLKDPAIACCRFTTVRALRERSRAASYVAFLGGCAAG